MNDTRSTDSLTAQRKFFDALSDPIEAPLLEWPEALVHFTNGDAFQKIIETRSLLFSASSVTNDTDEMLGGLEIVQNTLSPSTDYLAWCARMSEQWPEFVPAFKEYFNNGAPADADNLYLFSWCAHSVEHETGKLSMWRAYGSDGRGIAIGIDTTALIKNRDTTELPIQLHKTRYEDDVALCKTLMRIANSFAEHLSAARDIAAAEGIESACWLLFQAWFVASATRKHPGFSEEEEWRFIYVPRWDVSKKLTQGLEVSSVGGQLRPCFRLPIRDYAEFGMPGTDLNDILDCVIVGPNAFDALATRKAVCMLLSKAGIADPERRVRICHTPYRPAR